VSEHLRKSKVKVKSALNVFNKTISQIEQANKILEEGVAKGKENYDLTCNQIKHLDMVLDGISVDITQHEAEIKKNNELLAKLKGLTK
jgi:uncharacterized protein YaaN involved in tellurite resistance